MEPHHVHLFLSKVGNQFDISLLKTNSLEACLTIQLREFYVVPKINPISTSKRPLIRNTAKKRIIKKTAEIIFHANEYYVKRQLHGGYRLDYKHYCGVFLPLFSPIGSHKPYFIWLYVYRFQTSAQSVDMSCLSYIGRCKPAGGIE